MSKRILVVEDEPVSRQIIRLLVPADYERCGAAFRSGSRRRLLSSGRLIATALAPALAETRKFYNLVNIPSVARGTHAIVTLLVTGTGGFSKAFSSPASVGVSVRQAETV